MAKKIADLYTNRAYASLTLSAANTLTFQQIRWAVGTFEGIAIKLNRVEYHFTSTTMTELVAAADNIAVGLTARDDLASLDPSNQGVYNRVSLFPTAAPVELYRMPLTVNFTDLPNGGLLLPANPMFLAMNSTGFVAAAAVFMVLYYQFVRLTDKEALEVLQTVIPGNV